MKKLIILFVLILVVSLTYSRSSDSIFIKEFPSGKLYLKSTELEFMFKEGIPPSYNWNDDTININLLKSIDDLNQAKSLNVVNGLMIGIGILALGGALLIEKKEDVSFSILASVSLSSILTGLINFNTSQKYIDRSKVRLRKTKKMIEDKKFF